MMVIDRKQNGHVNWGFYLKLWPVAVTILGFAFWFGGRLENDQQKTNRILLLQAPLHRDLEVIKKELGGITDSIDQLRVIYERHHYEDGHKVIVERVNQMIMQMTKMQKDLDELKRRTST